MYSHQNMFSNTWWWNCGFRNYSKTWNAVISDVFGVHITHWLLCQTDKIQIFNPLWATYIRGYRWILVLLLIFVEWCKHPNTNVAGSKCILNWFCCVIWRPYAVFFLSKSPHYIMNCITNFSPLFLIFTWCWIWHISIIHCDKFEVYACSICDGVTIPTNACSSLFNKLKCC